MKPVQEIKAVLGVTVFAVAFAFVESAVVVYLRSIYYPDGFSLPLKLIAPDHLLVELLREFATIVMLVMAGFLAGSTRWQKMAWFMVAFGIWDIFYYVWLKFLLDWPSTLLEWDVLFLIPVPWIGPVIAPVVISVLMVLAGFLIIRREAQGFSFHPPRVSWLLSLAGTALILFTFVSDTGATLGGEMPKPYPYWLFALGILSYCAAMIMAFGKRSLGTGEGKARQNS